MPVDLSLNALRSDLGYVRPEWFGPFVADANTDTGGTDNSATLQAALNSGYPVVLGPGRYGIGTTLSMNPADGMLLAGTFGGHLGPDDTNHGTSLVWQGAANGTLIDLRGIKSEIHDLLLTSAKNTSLACCVDLETPAVYPGTSSQHYFRNVVCDGRNGAVTSGWVVGQDNLANNEFHVWEACLTRYCTYAGISVPNSTRQAKNLVCRDCTFGGPGQYGVVFNSGSMDFLDCNWDALTCAVAWLGAANEPINFLSCTGETNGTFLSAAGVTYVNLVGCRLAMNGTANPQVFGQEYLRGGLHWNVTGCDFEDPGNLVGYLRPSDGGFLTVTGCTFNSPSPWPSDDLTRLQVSATNARVSLNNLLPQGGNFYLRNVPGLSNAGNGLLFSDGHWPINITYSGGLPVVGTGTGQLYLDSGKLWLALPGAASKALAFEAGF